MNVSLAEVNVTNKTTIFLNKLRKVKQVLASKAVEQNESQLFDCPVCGATQVIMHPLPMHYFAQWQKYQTIHNPFFIETMNIEHCICSKCFAFDRNRLYALYLDKYLFTSRHDIKLLDIAPDKPLQHFIQRNTHVKYRSMDLMMDDVDDKLDITNMHLYEDEQFDFFICSNVLEHIANDVQAMKELYRVLKQGGKGIVMVPINLQLENTLEDTDCTNAVKRWKYFFQDDHVRMYAKQDFVNRLSSAGFTVEQLDKEYFGEAVFNQYAIYPTSVLYLVNK